MVKRANPHLGRLVFLVWMLVAAFYFSLSYDYIRISMNDKAFAEYLKYVVQMAGSDQRSPKEIRTLLLVKSEQLDLPILGEQIAVNGRGTTLNVAVNYIADVEVPIFDKGIYHRAFEHDVTYTSPR